MHSAYAITYCTIPRSCQINFTNNSANTLVLSASVSNSCLVPLLESELQAIKAGASVTWNIGVDPNCPLTEMKLKLQYIYDQNGGYPLFCTIRATLKKSNDPRFQNLGLYLDSSSATCDPPMMVSGTNDNFVLTLPAGLTKTQ